LTFNTLTQKSERSHHSITAISLNDLALLYLTQGRYREAEPLFQRSLKIRENQLGPDHLKVANGTESLASLYQAQGRYEEAEPLFQRSLQIRENRLGSDHYITAISLNNLAVLYLTQERYKEAEPLFQRSLKIRENQLGPDHLKVATVLNNLAELQRLQGHYGKAEQLLKRSLQILESHLSTNHLDVAVNLNNLAGVYSLQGRYEEAAPLFQRSLKIRETQLGTSHPDVSGSLRVASEAYYSQGKYNEALMSLSRSLRIEEANLSDNITLGSEAQKQDYVAKISGTIDASISLNLQAQPTNPQATHLALTTLLRRKGRILDATTTSLALLRQNLTSEDQKILNQLADRTTQLSALPYSPLLRTNPTAYQQQLKTLTQQVTELQTTLARRSATFRQQTQPITLEAIQTQIPKNTTLLEFTRYQPFNPKANPGKQWGTPRYAAYLLTRDGKIDAIDLGEAAPIDQLTADFRAALENRSTNPKPIARQLDQALMQPLRAKLPPTTNHLLISPDSHLNLIPFAALVDERDRYLIETIEISYLSSGRDLLHLQNPTTSTNPPLLLANPDYNTASAPRAIATANPKGTQRTTDLPDLPFPPLPSTAEEAAAIAPKLPGLTLLTATQATETALKQAQSPRILHIATHGFFIKDLPQPNLNDNRGLFASRSFFDLRAGAQPDIPIEMPTARPYNPNNNPLLRSGLALAGANRLNGGNKDSDGILTALEASQLNLRGTQLVILSACETAVGDVANGEGIYGLRRAFTLAGAQTQLISLWQVSDAGTKDLMISYYDNLVTGQGRSQALLTTQRNLLKDPQYNHPYYWASFILSGNWQPLQN
jgi:CHAT domain-containing protein/Tfp pilus assembly protein PilF